MTSRYEWNSHEVIAAAILNKRFMMVICLNLVYMEKY